jgi:hypothetical protein
MLYPQTHPVENGMPIRSSSDHQGRGMVGGDKISTPLGGVKVNKESGRFTLIFTREKVIRVTLSKRS